MYDGGDEDSNHGVGKSDRSHDEQEPGLRRQVCKISAHNHPVQFGTNARREKFPGGMRKIAKPQRTQGSQSLVAATGEPSWYASGDMGMASLLRKVFLVDLLQGMRVTFRYQDPKEIYTEQYPLERPQVAERYRGAPRLNVNPDTDETMCIACDLCALACPENLIVVSSARNENTRRKELTDFTYDLSRCMFCGLCEDACPVDALELTQDFELASYTREGWIWDRKTLEKGPQPTQYQR
jgi:NADH-quinone oxidoreductase subunit I